MTDMDSPSHSRSRSRSRERAMAKALQEKIMTDMSPYIAQQMDDKFMQFSKWIPPWVNLAFVSDEATMVLSDIFQDTGLGWQWYCNQWVFWKKYKNSPHVYLLSWYMDTSGYWDYVVVQK